MCFNFRPIDIDVNDDIAGIFCSSGTTGPSKGKRSLWMIDIRLIIFIWHWKTWAFFNQSEFFQLIESSMKMNEMKWHLKTLKKFDIFSVHISIVGGNFTLEYFNEA